MSGPPRSDLRQYEELRPMEVEFEIAPEAVSSVILCQGRTKVAVCVHGPAQPRSMRYEKYDKCTLNVEYRANYSAISSKRNIQENDGIVMLQNVLTPALILEQFPRMMIIVKINVLQDDGSLNDVVINACTLALSKSGIPMNYMPISVSCVKSKEGFFLLDPVSSEELPSDTVSTHGFVFISSLPHHENITSSSSTGSFSLIDMRSALELCGSASVNINNIMKKNIMSG